jgi:hypothetical protein
MVNEDVLPTALFVGMSEERLYKCKSFDELKPYIEAQRRRNVAEEQQAWLQGLYIKAALSSTAVAVWGITDKTYPFQEYPKNPAEEEHSKSVEVDEQYIANERLKLWAYWQNRAMVQKYRKG